MEGAQKLDFTRVLQEYPPDKFILLMPQVSRHIAHLTPMWSIDVAVVKIDPDCTGLVFPVSFTWDKRTQPWTKRPERLALQKAALDQLCAAADVQVATQRTDDRTNRLRAEFAALAVMQTPSGAVRGQVRSIEWDGELEMDKIRASATEYVDARIADHNADANKYRDYTEANRTRLIESRFNAEWLREREFGKRKAESKAAARAVRTLLGLQPSYGYQELKDKPFAIVRFVFTPDVSNPEILKAVVNAGIAAQRQLFGSSVASAVGGLLLPGASAAEAMQAAPAPARPAGTAHVDVEATVDDAEPEPTYPSTWEDVLAEIPSISQRVAAYRGADKPTVDKQFAHMLGQQDGAGIGNLMRQYKL